MSAEKRIEMERLFHDPAFWRREERLKTKCLRGEYDEPREEETIYCVHKMMIQQRRLLRS